MFPPVTAPTLGAQILEAQIYGAQTRGADPTDARSRRPRCCSVAALSLAALLLSACSSGSGRDSVCPSGTTHGVNLASIDLADVTSWDREDALDELGPPLLSYRAGDGALTLLWYDVSVSPTAYSHSTRQLTAQQACGAVLELTERKGDTVVTFRQLDTDGIAAVLAGRTPGSLAQGD